jgi:D-aspartate ligase
MFLDKKNTCAIAESAGVPAPKTYLPRCIEDIEAWSFDIQFPCLAKPSQSHRFRQHFNRKMTWVNNLDELIRAFRALEGTDVEMMVQEYIPGSDELGANYNAYYLDGKPLVEFTAHKIRNAPPAMGSPCALVSEPIPEVIEPGRRLLGAANFSGFACSEFKRDPRDGVYKLMEVNVRHNLSSALAVRCGMNFPWLQYRHLVDGIAPDPQDYQVGVYWVDITRDVHYWVFGKKKNGFTLKSYLEPYIKKHVFAIFDWKDLGPAILRLGVTLTSLFTKSMGD